VEPGELEVSEFTSDHTEQGRRDVLPTPPTTVAGAVRSRQSVQEAPEAPTGATLLRVLVVDEQEVQRLRLVRALNTLGVLAVREAASQLEALLVAVAEPIDLIVYGLDSGLEFSGDLEELGQSLSIVLTGPLNPAMVECVTPFGREEGLDFLQASQRPLAGANLREAIQQAQSEGQSLSKTITISQRDVLLGLDAREFRLYYEPTVRLSDGELVAAEGSLRWQHTEYGLLLPSVFMDSIDDPEIDERIVHATFELALAAVREWGEIGLFLNLSLDFLSHRGAANQLLGIFIDFPEVQSRLITFGVPESALLHPSDALIVNLSRLRTKGFGLALDNYAAVTTLEHVSRVPFNILTLSPSHLTGSAHKRRVGAILESSQNLASKLGLTLVARGVRRSEEWNMLTSLGFDLAQGELISNPLGHAPFLTWARVYRDSTADQAPVVVQAEVGETLGHYRLDSVLGKGGLGTVYLATDTRLLRPVAVKVCHDKNLSPETLERFLREARALARVHHPGVVTIYEIGLEPFPHIAMEVLDGEDLSRVGKADSAEQAREWALQMLEALAAVHARGIIHRDLKPSNIMLDSEGHIRIMDFGIAKIIEDDAKLTQTGHYCGTPQYMSPEQVDSSLGTVDERSDLFAIGSIFYELLTGKPAVRLSTISHIMHQLLLITPPTPSEVSPDVPQALSDICMRAIEKKPENRYESAAAFAQALREA
jgi:EAL domain-containing protein (putative c-di-GMP-specific phosphodiesterase class I)